MMIECPHCHKKHNVDVLGIRKELRSKWGSMGGKKSKRVLTTEQAREMVAKRWGKNDKA